MIHLMLPILILLSESLEKSALKVHKQVQCDWTSQFICGDKCTEISKLCLCGELPLPFNFAGAAICCNKKPCLELQGNVWCKEGSIERWWKKCDGMESGCKQMSHYGYTTLPCDDQKNCYLRNFACQGKGRCPE